MTYPPCLPPFQPTAKRWHLPIVGSLADSVAVEGLSIRKRMVPASPLHLRVRRKRCLPQSENTAVERAPSRSPSRTMAIPAIPRISPGSIATGASIVAGATRVVRRGSAECPVGRPHLPRFGDRRPPSRNPRRSGGLPPDKRPRDPLDTGGTSTTCFGMRLTDVRNPARRSLAQRTIPTPRRNRMRR